MKKYIINGDPVPLARCRVNGRRIWDSQKELKVHSKISLANQHGTAKLYNGPLHFDITFFMPLPKDKKKRKHLLENTYHFYKPDLDNLVKFICDISNNVLYKDDCIISSILAQKIYDDCPRTEFSIKELK